MDSRLDRLFILLDTGSNETIRLAAAKQLGEVQRIQPNDLHYLLKRIKEFSCKNVWETRVAAGHATRCVLENLDRWSIRDFKQENRQILRDEPYLYKETISSILKEHADTKRFLTKFDLNKVVTSCPTLLSMDAIDDDDLDLLAPAPKRAKGQRTSTSSRKTKEHLLRQRQLINKELGISMSDSLNLGVTSADIISNDDLQAAYTTDISNRHPHAEVNQQQDIKKVLQDHVSNYQHLISALENAKVIPILDQGPEPNPINNRWPLEEITNDYLDNLFNPSWEIRHGSAIALREIIRLHGKSAGRLLGFPDDFNEQLNQVWLVDSALRTLCVLGLDRFGDFLFDQVVAPVRENAAQLLGCCVASLDGGNSELVIQILLKMLEDKRWETRHGGILGLKYSLSVLEHDLMRTILKTCFNSIFRCLDDENDDVSAEAAASLLPVSSVLNETIPEEAPKLIKFLWEHLAKLDDLTTSTSNIILLLASLITSSSTQLDSSELISSIPKLWSLLSHSSTNVRISVLKAIAALIKPQKISCLIWMPEDLMSAALRLVFQRSILENMDDVRPLIEDVWTELLRINDDKLSAQTQTFNLLRYSSQHLNYWLCLCMQPANTPIDRSNPSWLNIKVDGSPSDVKPDGEVYIASSNFNAETADIQKLQISRCRLLGTKLLGQLYARLVEVHSERKHSEETLIYLSEMFVHYLKTKSAQQRTISGWAIETWASHRAQQTDCDSTKAKLNLPSTLKSQLYTCIQETNLCFDELAPLITRLQSEARDFVNSLVDLGIETVLPHSKDRRLIYNLNQIQTLCELRLEDKLDQYNKIDTDKSQTKRSDHDTKGSEAYSLLNSKQTSLVKCFNDSKMAQKSYSVSVLSSLACSLIAWAEIPDTLSLVIEPLMDSIEMEADMVLLDKSIRYLIKLLDILCQREDSESERDKIINRLVGSLYQYFTDRCMEDMDSNRIIRLDNLLKIAESSSARAVRRKSSVNGSISGALKRSNSLTSGNLDQESLNADQSSNILECKYRGSLSAMDRLAKHFSLELPEKLPNLWTSVTSDLKAVISLFCDGKCSHDTEEKLIKGLITLESIVGSVDKELYGDLYGLFSDLIKLLTSRKSVIRHHGARCIGSIARVMFDRVEKAVIDDIIPLLGGDIISRCGSIEAIALIIDNLQLGLVPKINMFIVQVLRRMSDQVEQVRLMATHCFGRLMSLMPLNLNKTKSESYQIKSEFQSANEGGHDEGESKFIEQLLNPRSLNLYKIPFELGAKLRSYQQDGINWLAFLNKFNLHGILCDEMGLGKTFMTICIVAADHFKQESSSTDKFLPSLIVCPPTLIEHWLFEIEKFVPSRTRAVLNPVAYAGSISDRAYLRKEISDIFHKHKSQAAASDVSKSDKKQPINIIITSYDVLRNDIDFFKSFELNYCVLDEGHIIKNGRTKLSKAIRQLTAAHRLILSGTPIQNNVTELWSLFDFLMPGFLGSERQFNAKYAKPILQSRDSKCSTRELEAGALAMESLHRQVLPFILRRLKEDVLADLPPKIIQDYYCEMSPLQMKLYEDFTRSELCKDVTCKSLNQLEDQAAPTNIKIKSKSHVFQALQYLRNVCNHPKLVLSAKHPQFNTIKKLMSTDSSSLDDMAHSSKLIALKQLLIDCGIGSSQSNEDQLSSAPVELVSVVNQHRALVFCQSRSMVDIIESDLLKKHLISVTYLRLDGSIPVNQRQSIVSRFNKDPSIDVLLLTTQIGGLGLNLTGADTVIFVEHDWNPTRDLQAMDRAHRIGQKKVVSVYRLITKNTLEEKIMGLQKFKTMISSTVINQDNTGLDTMNVSDLLDLFGHANPDSTKEKQSTSQDKQAKGQSNLVDILPDLWDQQQYEAEYDLSTFVASLKS